MQACNYPWHQGKLNQAAFQPFSSTEAFAIVPALERIAGPPPLEASASQRHLHVLGDFKVVSSL